ncbi:hypothetical protein ACQPYH_02855 [Kribbella sp. CA-245084]|uniref:hypothetical protein n=1 Tax=Kribbella sp. CA-245084 TaxID=3239940 RepID=UPI003D8C8ED5
MKKHLSAALAMICSVAGLTVVTSQTASAVGCVGESCYNKGPVSMGCTADQRLISDPRWSPDLQILYSPACQAAWAVSLAPPLDQCIAVQIERSRSDHIVQARLSQEFCPEETKEWTNMMPRGWYFRAVWNDYSPGYSDLYTPWVFR